MPRRANNRCRPPSSPVLFATRRGAIVGAIYGYRSVRAGNARRGIRYLEAHWIELLAGAVSDAMLRLERDSQVDRRRVLLERTAMNSGRHDRRAMAAETREVTLLFADLRDFTRRAESLDMDVVYEFLGHVMDALTAAVMDHDGLVLDYYGDGLAAMWNAPADQADHAELACRAGLRMLESMPDVDARLGPRHRWSACNLVSVFTRARRALAMPVAGIEQNTGREVRT